MSLFTRLIFSRFQKNGERFAVDLRELIGFKPKNLALYKLAFRHSSASNGKAKQINNNERLEFLGDAILSAVVADYLYNHYTEESEGFLTSMRSKIVSRQNLNSVSKSLGLERFIVSKLSNKRNAKSLGGDTLEALIGAIYLDLGQEEAANFIHQKILSEKRVFNELEQHVISYKGIFIEWAQKERKKIAFTLIDQWGKQHSKTFKMGLFLDNELIATGKGASKKRAEEDAAKKAFDELNLSV